jgi:AraC-like DNA-binding protein
MVDFKTIFTDDSKDVVFTHSITKICDVDIHLHDSYEIFMAVSDNIRYNVEGKAYDMHSGDIVITNEREIHRPLTIDNGVYNRKFIQFSPQIFTSFFNKKYNPLTIFEDRDLGSDNYFSSKELYYTKIYELFDEIELLSKNTTQRTESQIKALTIQLLIELEIANIKQYTNNDKNVVTDERIVAIKEELDKTFKEPFSLDALSQKLYMDKYYMCHLFKKTTGFSLLEYVQSKRIQYAKILLHKGVNISEASRQCGFEEYSNFYKTFKKLVKLSPKQYRDSLRL